MPLLGYIIKISKFLPMNKVYKKCKIFCTGVYKYSLYTKITKITLAYFDLLSNKQIFQTISCLKLLQGMIVIINRNYQNITRQLKQKLPIEIFWKILEKSMPIYTHICPFNVHIKYILYGYQNYFVQQKILWKDPFYLSNSECYNVLVLVQRNIMIVNLNKRMLVVIVDFDDNLVKVKVMTFQNTLFLQRMFLKYKILDINTIAIIFKNIGNQRLNGFVIVLAIVQVLYNQYK
eukprot:TRINITY_DN931_c0_g2_i6.p4 TRINITY_DN931_c0_g2~~TRINITY_DN931_c0_g2_i6.p4  ORF type:complete len:233 (-),score=-13.70 TRINITY_DN931_c0_g2_i6:185-883(-)